MKSLILAEKPSVAREIARVLGCNETHKNYIEGHQYIVTWALGHLIELKMPEHYDKKFAQWNLEDLPIIPKKMETKVIKETSHQFKAIEQLTKRNDLDECIIATDAGREGELVARWILEKTRWKKPIKRLWISSYTDQAIRDGFRKLRPGSDFDPLYQSAQCRAEADWLIGLNVTRALTTKYQEPLSAGRVQTPTLSLIFEREKQIQLFQPSQYWTISGEIGGLKVNWEKNGEKRIFSLEKANEVHQKLKGKQAKVVSITKKEKQETHPLPYDLTELQRDASNIFAFSAKKTLSVLQKLYEQHKLVTYPRTDSRYLTTDIEGTMLERLRGLASSYPAEVKPLLAHKGKVVARAVFNNQRVTDHHGIIPTEERSLLDHLTADEKKIYDLIVRRFLTLFLPDPKYITLKATFDVEGEQLTANEKLIVDEGFKVIFNKNKEEEKRSSIKVTEGQYLPFSNVSLEAKLTEPPNRYSEADVLSQMEKYGLGTPATRAEIIERLIQTEVVERKNGRFYTTPKGKQLLELVNEDLKSPELTAQWEKELENIARKKSQAKAFSNKIRKQTEELIAEIKRSNQSYRAHNLTGSKCPECGSFLKERKTKEGRVLVCSSLDCQFRKRKDPKLSNHRCPTCHKKMEFHQGKAGPYFQCRSCNIVEKAENKQKGVSKREEKKLIQKYNKQEDFGTSLGDLLKAAMKDQE